MASLGAEYTTGCIHTFRTLHDNLWAKLAKVTNMVKKLGQDDPRRIIYSFKVGLALVLISILQHFRPSFYGFGSNIWAAFSIIFILEVSVGPTLGNGLSEILATGSAGALGVASRSMATLCGEKGKTVFTLIFVFVIVGTVTFMRLSPRLKARYDYGLIMFISTFCVMSLSDYTRSERLEIAVEMLLTTMVGSCIAIVTCICIYPVWVGEDLHNQIAGNMEKLANFFEGFGDEYFNNSENTEAMDDKPYLQRYKGVLSSETGEETMAIFARWEPCHGRFRFPHPWKQYLKIGNLIRLCAYKIEVISVYLANAKQIPFELRSRIQESCTNISLECGKTLKEASLIIKHMAKSSTPNPHVANAKNAAESLKSVVRTNPWGSANNLETIPAAAVASLLIEAVICIEKICQAVDELESLANFVPFELLDRGTVQPICDRDGSVHGINERPPRLE